MQDDDDSDAFGEEPKSQSAAVQCTQWGAWPGLQLRQRSSTGLRRSAECTCLMGHVRRIPSGKRRMLTMRRSLLGRGSSVLSREKQRSGCCMRAAMPGRRWSI